MGSKRALLPHWDQACMFGCASISQHREPRPSQPPNVDGTAVETAREFVADEYTNPQWKFAHEAATMAGRKQFATAAGLRKVPAANVEASYRARHGIAKDHHCAKSVSGTRSRLVEARTWQSAATRELHSRWLLHVICPSVPVAAVVVDRYIQAPAAVPCLLVLVFFDIRLSATRNSFYVTLPKHLG
jgi:hypothetical protein